MFNKFWTSISSYIYLEYIINSNYIALWRDYALTRWQLKLQIWVLWQKQLISACRLPWKTDPQNYYLIQVQTISAYPKIFPCITFRVYRSWVSSIQCLTGENQSEAWCFQIYEIEIFRLLTHFYMDVFLQNLHKMTLFAASLLSSDRLHLSWHNGCAAAFIYKVKFRINLVTASVLPGKVFLGSTAAGRHAAVSSRVWLKCSGNN